MNFSFTEEQLMFKEQVMRFATKEIVPRVQEHELKGEFDFQSFRKLGEYGILGLHFPEELGGSNAKHLQIAGTSTEISRMKIANEVLQMH